MPAARTLPSDPFPGSGLIPKDSTQVLAFRRKYPHYDGRGVRIGILDTGVDVNAFGLNQRGHIVESIDCTGAGDIALTEVPEAAIRTSTDSLSVLSPATGRTILLSPEWINPRGTFKHGFKAAYGIWPADLVERRQAERQRAFDVETSRLVAHAQNQLDSALTQDSSVRQNKEESATSDGPKNVADTTKALLIADLRARIAVLEDLRSSWQDPGPIIEVIVFHDGELWRSVVGGGEGDIHDYTKGLPENQLGPLNAVPLDLRMVKPIADFSAYGEHDYFGEMDLLTYSVSIITKAAPTISPANLICEAETLSLVVVSGVHGTHVAGIVGARAGAQSSGTDIDPTDGVAPAAEIVSLLIADPRVGSHTGQSLLRAAQALIMTRCDIANMSIAVTEAFEADDKGTFVATLQKMVVRHRNILFVSSAGNDGPGLTTIGHPGASTSAVLSVGAFLTSGAMQRAEHARVEDCKDSTAIWSSRGPTSDGDRGVDIHCPGGAITCVPPYSLQRKDLLVGTSMASPNACGSIALLLSAMKHEKIPITAARVYRALKESGKEVQDELGVPFLQVDDAWNYLVKYKDRLDADAEFHIEVYPPGKPSDLKTSVKRGIYLREMKETSRATRFSVHIKPLFKAEETRRSSALDLQCAITTSANWVKVPQFLWLGGKGRNFEVRVDPTSLDAGRLHTAWIEVFDTATAGHKLFDIPVVVAKPALPSHGSSARIFATLSAGKVVRRFLHVPEGTMWAVARVCSRNHTLQDMAVKCKVHLVQLGPLQMLSDLEQKWAFDLYEDDSVTRTFAICGGKTVEICLAQDWEQAESFDLELDLEFHGIQISRLAGVGDELTILGGEGIARLECSSDLRLEDFEPDVSFHSRRTFIRPTRSHIHPLLGSRDTQASGQQMFELIITYQFSLYMGTNNIGYSFPLNADQHNSPIPLSSRLFDIQKRVVQFSGGVDQGRFDLPNGDYTLRVQLLNESLVVLKEQRSMTVRLDQKLSTSHDVKLNLYEDHADLVSDASPSSFSTTTLQLLPGDRKILCIDTDRVDDEVLRESSPGDVLLGTFSLGPVVGARLRYVLPPTVTECYDDEESEAQGMPGRLSTVELLTSLVSQIHDDSEKRAFLQRLLEDHQDDLGVMVANLEAHDVDEVETATEALRAADQVLALVDQTALYQWLGTEELSLPEQSVEVRQTNKLKEFQRSAVLLALNSKAKALLTMSPEGGQEFESIYRHIRTFYGELRSDSDFTDLTIRWHIIHKRYGLALQQIRTLLDEIGAGTAENLETLRTALERQRDLLAPDKLDWKVWLAHFDRLHVLRASDDWTPF